MRVPAARAAGVAVLGLALGLTLALAPVPASGGQTAGAPDDTSGDVVGLDPTDVVKLLPDVVKALLDHRLDMLRCPTLAGGTIGNRESRDEPGRTGPDLGNPLKAGDRSRAPRWLPDQVVFRTTTQTYNRRYQFAVARGTIWYKSNTAVTGIREPWARMKVSPCVDGKVTEISADDDEMIVVDRDRWIYDVDGILRTPKHFSWSLRWGPPFWTGPGMQMPRGFRTWAWSVVSPLEDVTWTDPAGNKPRVGAGKVSHIWLLSNDGRRLVFRDPWLPVDNSYATCLPHRDRFKVANMNASGSTLFVIGRHGDMFTRLFDFDISGDDSLFFKYSYSDQRGRANPRIQLPAEPWARQPKIPGTITDRISIAKRGTGTVHRTLRVEGRRGGKVGYWQKDLRAKRWRFVATGGRLHGRVLDNPQRNTSAVGLGASTDRRYVGWVPGARITIPDYNTYCSPARVRIRLSTGERFTLRLHTVDNIRQGPRRYGLDGNPRATVGMLEVPPAVRAGGNAHVRAFLAGLGPGRWAPANLDATAGRLSFRFQDWTLVHRG